LLLLHVGIDAAIRFHFFDLAQAAEGPADGLKIGQCAAQPAFGHKHLSASLCRFLDRFLRLLFGADEQNFAAFGDRFAEEFTGFIQLIERFAQVNDVDAVTGIENEAFHLWVPAFGLMAKVNTRFKQFFNSNIYHNFPLLRARLQANHPAEHGILLFVVLARHLHAEMTNSGRFIAHPGNAGIKRAVNIAEEREGAKRIFGRETALRCSKKKRGSWSNVIQASFPVEALFKRGRSE